MTQNQHPPKLFNWRPQRLSQGLGVAVWLLVAATARGQATNVEVTTTATQAVITYTAPDMNACLIDVREMNAQNPLVHDVDPVLYPGSNLDTRPGGSVVGQKRVVVVGKRTAEPALDGNFYSRALQTNTDHLLTITCGTQSYSGHFETENYPLGMSYNDPLPVDPNNPGQYAWPTIQWTNRNQWIVDPQTGFLLKQFDSPRDAWDQTGFPGNFASASPVSGSTWTNAQAVLADDTTAATYSGTTQDWLFLELGQTYITYVVHTAGSPSVNSLVPTFNAWCSSSDCTTASAADRSLQFCITTDGVSCASDMLQAVLSACSANCTGSAYRVPGIVNPQAMLADWFASKGGIATVDITGLSKHNGSVNRTGASVAWIGGDHFSLAWGPGTPITINGTVYAVASIGSDGTLTLSGSPAGSDSGAPYTVSSAGILVRKATAGGQQISLQYASFYYETGEAETVSAAGDEDTYGNCSPQQVPGPGGEMGWHCVYGSMLHWVGATTGTNNRLGRDVIPYNGSPNGWLQGSCSGGAIWDFKDGNSYYCAVRSFQGNFLLFKVTYSGSNEDQGDSQSTQSWVSCGSPPCWTPTLLTPSGQALEQQLAAFVAFDPLVSFFRSTNIQVFGRMSTSNALLFLARRDGATNDTLAIIFKYDLNVQQVTAVAPTWRTWPMRWAGSHGPGDLNDPDWVFVSATNFRGQYSGTDFLLGNGPYLSTITSGPVGTAGQACPARPADSPIAVSDWPTGNQCLLVTVDGEPGDPTPVQYSTGTISVSGTTVTGNNTYFTSLMDQGQIQIGGNIYIFSYVSPTQGTLNSSPGTLTNVAYTIYLEPVNNPKVGNPTYAYLQDAEVRDIFCATNNQIPCNITLYQPNEYMRLILKDPQTPNNWWLQRGYGGAYSPKQTLPLNANAWLTAVPASCYFNDVYPCPQSQVLWNATLDPQAQNATGTTLALDPNDTGCCHTTRQQVSIDLAQTCPVIDNNSGACYFARFAGLPAVLTETGYTVSFNPVFNGKVGVGFTNAVDIHPSHNQFLASDNEKSWITDARPFLGDDGGNPGPMTGSASAPGTLVAGSLYKFTSAQTARLRPRSMPTHAACGSSPLLDVSGPGSALSSNASDAFKYCIALNAGECTSGSNAGDLYVNCPQTRLPYCVYQGIGNSDPETRDICVFDLGAYTNSVVQLNVRPPGDPDGRLGRRISHMLGRYHWVYEFWNAKAFPDGHWMVGQTTFLQGLRSALMLIKIPPFPYPDGINRGDYIPVKLTVPQSTLAGVNNAIVQFGYNPGYQCTSRSEPCLTQLPSVVQSTGNAFAYQSESPAGVPCANGCTITVPAISQRVLYYQVLLRDANNNVIATASPEVRAIP